MAAQSMPDTSPAKWHLAHTTWFFETFVLAIHDPGHRPHHAKYGHLFNSYYNGVGERHPRPLRGLITRPDTQEVLAYRKAIDVALLRLIERGPDDSQEALRVIEIGLHHEQQHQELLLTDIKHLFSQNPLEVCYRTALATPDARATATTQGWLTRAEGLFEVGHAGNAFAFDNERPRHRVFLEEHAIADRLVTNAEFQAFIDAGGYARPELWLDRGWASVCESGWRSPFYWRGEEDARTEFTLAGLRPLVANEPVSHVSFFEADAFARWAGARLPREAEWEVLAAASACEGNFAESDRLHPQASIEGDHQLFGDVWEWTSSPYGPYPGFEPEAGTLGEYNGKFMSSQMTLRGGSCASAQDHVRATYRNFFHPPDRWQFSGIRLAKDS
jgi:ergothioneine biosynthesis protein EgtB